MICCHHDIGNTVVLDGLHALDSLSSPVLISEILDRHALYVAHLGRGDDCRLIRDHILDGDFGLIKFEFCSSLVSVFIGNLEKLLPDHAEKKILVCKNCLQSVDRLQETLIFRFDLSSFQTGQSTQTHVNDCLGLCVGEFKAFHELSLGCLDIFGTADNCDDLVDIVKRDQQTFQNMSPLLRFVEIILCPSGDDFLLMHQVVHQNIPDVHHLRFAVHQRKVDDTERILQLRMLIELVENDVGIGIPADFNADFHSLTARVIAKRCDAVDLFISDEIRDRLDEPCLVDKIGELRHKDLGLSGRLCLDPRDRPHNDLASSRTIGIFDSFPSENNGTCREIGSLYDRHKIIDRRILSLDLIIDHADTRADDLPQIVRRHIRRHTYRYTGRSVDQQVRDPGRKDRRLLLRLVKVRNEINGILVDIREHLHGDFRESRLRITHGSR